jgi:uncharacterized metal-binding protein
MSDVTKNTPVELQAGITTHENVLVPCVGGFSNTGMTTFFATMEVIKTLGLQKVSDVCITSISLHIPTVEQKIKAAKKIIAIDGCPNMCAKKLLEKEGFKVAESIVLDRDIKMTKVPFSKVMTTPITEMLKPEEIDKAKELIIQKLGA